VKSPKQSSQSLSNEQMSTRDKWIWKIWNRVGGDSLANVNEAKVSKTSKTDAL
jgi:hypothetical protein